MPVRRRTARRVSAYSGEDARHIFFWSQDGSGLDSMITQGEHFETAEEARAASEDTRRLTWQWCHRFSVPRSATFYDGITDEGIAFVRHRCWTNAHLEAARELLDADRASIAAFRHKHPSAAREIADFLQMRLEDLEVAERTAREFVTGTRREPDASPSMRLSSAQTYGPRR